jgi:hypothetical protein
VTGAAGAYGGYVVQLAKAEGLTVIADASEKDEKLVASLGADIVVRRGDNVASRIREYFPQGVDGVADGAVLKELVIPAVRDGGAFNSVRGFQGTPQRDIHFTATSVRTYAQEFEKLDRLRQQVEAGIIMLRVAEVYPPVRSWWYERPAGHPILIGRTNRKNRSASASGPFDGRIEPVIPGLKSTKSSVRFVAVPAPRKSTTVIPATCFLRLRSSKGGTRVMPRFKYRVERDQDWRSWSSRVPVT